MPVGTRLPLVSSSVLLANRRGLQRILGRSRAATFGRLFEGTDEISLGQTSADRGRKVDISHSSHGPPGATKLPAVNVAERLALRQKTVSFWQCRSAPERRPDNEARMPERSRAHRVRYHCDEPTPAASPPVKRQSEGDCPCPQPVDNYVDSSSSFSCGPRTGLEGVPVIDC